MNASHDLPLNGSDTSTDVDDTEAAGEELSPGAAASLLASTERHARRQFTRVNPYAALFGSLVLLTCYGSLWLSVRGQHPYTGPSLGVIGLVYAIVVVSTIVLRRVFVPGTAGVTGRTKQQQTMDAIPFGSAIICFYVFLGALKYDGFSNAIVYGVVDAAGPWLVAGAVLTAIGAAREDWWRIIPGLAVMAVGTTAAFFGPSNVWGLLALFGFVGCIARFAAGMYWLRQP